MEIRVSMILEWEMDRRLNADPVWDQIPEYEQKIFHLK